VKSHKHEQEKNPLFRITSFIICITKSYRNRVRGFPVFQIKLLASPNRPAGGKLGKHGCRVMEGATARRHRSLQLAPIELILN
jgi:hypothetical protein